MARQITDTILMVRPASFGFNAETAKDNAFQKQSKDYSSTQVAATAQEEFDTLVEKLKAIGVKVDVVADSEQPVKNDAIFPNNWLSTHEHTLLTYPMFSPSRRQERRSEIVDMLVEKYNYQKHIPLEDYEKQGLFLEGTGSMVLDRANKIAYACRSIRTDEALMDRFCDKMGYSKFLFDAVDENKHPIYHTNVMMAMGDSFCVVCLDSIRHAAQGEALVDQLKSNNKTIIEITLDQMGAFAGNMLQVASSNGEKYLVMSSRAYASLSNKQIQVLEQHTKLLHSAVETIENNGGGSVRCMMAEVFY